MQTTIDRCPPPDATFLQACAKAGAWADCFTTEVNLAVSPAQFIEAFYTSGLFKLERIILRLVLGQSSTDADARRLAQGSAASFAAWHVEDRNERELLLTDFTGRTRSWLMASAVERGVGAVGTRLYFGSAVGRAATRGASKNELGFWFCALLGFHTIYSRLLLRAARARVLDRARARG